MTPIQKAMRNAIREIKRGIKSDFEEVKITMGKLERARNRPDLLKIKAPLIVDIINCIPTFPEQCPYCYDNLGENSVMLCITCEYGKKKGICGNSESEFAIFCKMRSKLISQIKKTFIME